MAIPIYNTYIHSSAAAKVTEVLSSTFLSEGALVKQFEESLTADLGLVNTVALNSGTTALHLALVLAGVGAGDEVIIPAQTFVATGLVVLQQQATPVFADVDIDTGNISVRSIREKITPRTKAIIPVHWGGYPCDMAEINAIAGSYGLVVIEDAAHALGATYRGKAIGTISDHTCFSFQAIKHLTTGDGGALCIADTDKYHEARTRRWFGIDRRNAAVSELGERRYDIPELGFKYHLNDYAAALGLANLNGFKDRLLYRKQLAAIYDPGLRGVTGIKQFNYSADRESAYWLYGFHVENRPGFIRKLKEHGITASVIHQRIDRNSIFGGPKDLPAQKAFDDTQIHIPMHDAVTIADAEFIVETIKSGW